MIPLKRVHHIAIICSNYQKSKKFYTEILGFKIENETFREERNSYKLDLSLNGNYIIELFSFPNLPARTSHPESCGLRHIAFEVDHIEEVTKLLHAQNIICEPISIEELTNKNLLFLVILMIYQ
jgi:glyoxylase I family protein